MIALFDYTLHLRGIMVNSPSLNLGWQLDIAGVAPPGVPVNLRAPGLKSHTAIIAQSGSGKSFMLGRLLEEIASKTYARVVILDPNSDFVRFSEVEPNAWDKVYLKPWFGSEDTQDQFQKRWATVGFDILTNREPDSLALTNPGASINALYLRWGSLTPIEQANYLGFSVANNPDEVYALYQVNFVTEKNWKKDHGETPFTFTRFEEFAAALWAAASSYDKQWPSEWPLEEFRSYQGIVSPSAALSLYARVHEIASYKIWDRAENEKSLPSHLKSLIEKDASKRVLCIDLASLDKAEERLSLAGAALNTIWDVARQAWVDAIRKPSDEDARYPIFIVIDEAHNLAPAQPETVLARFVNNILARIATEGRKYGLFLILVTQRPTRLDPTLLSQCDSLCLLKMNNRLDLELVENGFGFLPEGWSKRALDFKVGDVLFSGSFVERPIYSHVAPRRTAEGGRNLEDSFWLRDPYSEAV